MARKPWYSCLHEESGKLSFARLFGALVMLSVLAGWWVDLATGLELPDLTAQILGAAMLPYLGNKLSDALAKILS